MKILISPAKSLGQQKLRSALPATEGVFLNEAEVLAKKLKKFSVKKIEKLMDVSSDIANLNFERFQAWERPVEVNNLVLPAIAQFAGEVYRGLNPSTMNDAEMHYAQSNLRILSGMYGILKPMDMMFPYRLEMGTSWSITPKVKNLYQFWGKKLSNNLKAEMLKDEVIVNLASAEYFKAIDKKAVKSKVITPHFKELKKDKYTIVAIFAKNARGRMARYAIENQISDAEQLKNFNQDGYLFHEALSTETDWVFTR